MRILIAGGAGFIGSNFIRYELNKYPNDSFVCLDKLTYSGNLRNLSKAIDSDNFCFVKGDICDRTRVFKLCEVEKFDIIVNFAAESHVDRSIKNPRVVLESNIIGTQVLMDACIKFGIKRYHQISTDEVYGDLPLDRPELSFSEESKLNPSSPYSASKAGADLLVNAYCKTYGINATISRCSNNYGAYQFPEKLIPLSIINALQEKNIPLYGDGKNIRDWIYVKDHCKAVDMIIRSENTYGIYNVGTEVDMSNIDLVRMICRLLDRSEKLISYVSDRKGHDLRYSVNCDRIKKELGWTPDTKFEDGICKTVNWYIHNQEWWKNLI